MKKYLLCLMCIVFLSLIKTVNAQIKSPFFYWSVDSVIIDSNVLDLNHYVHKLNDTIGKIKTINTHPTLSLNVKGGVLKTKFKVQPTYIAGYLVYKVKKSNRPRHLFEYNINNWYNYQISTSSLIVNGKQSRIADSSAQEVVVSSFYTKINIENPEEDTVSIQLLGNDSIPFVGEIAEIMLLNEKSGNRNHNAYLTHFALKYGVTLYKTDYIDLNADTLWNYIQNEDYTYNMACIGRYDSTGLNQKQGSTSNSNGDIRIALGDWERLNKQHTGLLNNNQRLIWGQNEPASFQMSLYQSSIDSLYYKGNCTWKIMVCGENTNQLYTKLYFDSLSIDSGQIEILIHGTEPPSPQNYNACRKVILKPLAGNSRILKADSVRWDIDNNGYDYFTLHYAIAKPDTPFFNLVWQPYTFIHNKNNSLTTNISGQESPSSTLSKSTSANQIALANQSTLLSSVYPNPSSQQINIKIKAADTETLYWHITNAQGQVMHHNSLYGEKSYMFNLDFFTAGTYTLQVRQHNQIVNQKFQINR